MRNQIAPPSGASRPRENFHRVTQPKARRCPIARLDSASWSKNRAVFPPAADLRRQKQQYLLLAVHKSALPTLRQSRNSSFRVFGGRAGSGMKSDQRSAAVSSGKYGGHDSPIPSQADPADVFGTLPPGSGFANIPVQPRKRIGRL